MGNAGPGNWLVTLGMNALVPVVKRRGVGLDLDDTGPGILARWLVEMAVDDECGHGLIRTQAAKRHKRLKQKAPAENPFVLFRGLAFFLAYLRANAIRSVPRAMLLRSSRRPR